MRQDKQHRFTKFFPLKNKTKKVHKSEESTIKLLLAKMNHQLLRSSPVKIWKRQRKDQFDPKEIIPSLTTQLKLPIISTTFQHQQRILNVHH